MENLNLSTKVDLNSYGMDDKLQKPYERPAFEWMLTGNYNIDNKIVFGGDVFYVGGRYAADLGEKNITSLKPFFDMNAHVSYSFENVKGLKAFVELNNIFGNQYMIWNNYPVRGFQIVGGVMFSFL
jgi:outer membrane receptor protein involved in Fe transport